MMISLAGLNPMQKKAAESIHGPVLILAGAGSGKTRTITYRIAHMVANLGISTKEILGVSFTNKAAKEMRERVITLLGKTKSRGLTLATFHSLCVRILKKEIDKLGQHRDFSIYDTSDQLGIIREALGNYHSDKDEGYDRKVILAKISLLKNKDVSEEEFADSPFFDASSPYDLATEYCYHYYQDKLRFYNAIDFDDILYLTVRLLRKFPEVAKTYSEKFKFIMVDEYQDTNPLQFELILHLTCCHKNLCVVGDDDQSIYAFRGADVSNILSFEKNYPGCKVVKLEENYRSIQPILELANEVIAKNKNRKEKRLWSSKQAQDDKYGGRPILWQTANTDHEAEAVVQDILDYYSNGGFLGEVAILYRSKTQVGPFEDQLRMTEIPYSILGGQKLYERKEIKDLLAYLSIIHNPSDELSLRRVLNVPHRGIGNATLDKYIARQKEGNTTLFQALKNNPSLDPQRAEGIKGFLKIAEDYQTIFREKSLPEALGHLIEALDYFKFIDHVYAETPKQAERRKSDVMRLIDSADRFSRYYKQNATLGAFVGKMMLQDSQDENDDQDEDARKNQVVLMTLHSSKGLEYDRVYLVGMEEETLPHKKTISEGSDISEERRLCYVGMTRAREKLIMTYCKERKIYGKMLPRHKSRFLLDIPEELFISQDRTTFGHLTPDEAEDYKKSFFSDLFKQIK